MTPNQITALRILMAFLAVSLFGRTPAANLAAVFLTLATISLDALDGWVARRRGLATPLGAHLDILGDRIIENLFFTYFAVVGLISLWVPVFFFVRGTATDFLRGLAARSGRSGFGRDSMMQSPLGRALVTSRASRASYGVLKCACFIWLGLELWLSSTSGSHTLETRSIVLFLSASPYVVGLTVVFCLVRGLPVLCEGSRYLLAFEGHAPSVPSSVTSRPLNRAA